MPRSARKESGVGIYHVMMRGINRQAIFDDDEDCRRFMDILADLPFQHDDEGRLLPIRTCVVYAWCLMTNHFPAGDGEGLEDSRGEQESGEQLCVLLQQEE